MNTQTHGPKKAFHEVIGDIIAKYGETISRPDLRSYCRENNVSIPAVIREHRAGRGWFNLKPLVEMYQAGNIHVPTAAASDEPPAPEMTDEEIEKEINGSFASLDLLAYGVIEGDLRSLIVSGNPGTGKTYTLESILDKAAFESKIMYQSVRGYVRATGLYRLLYEHRHKECVLMLDDADSVFQDETALNLLKGALDTTKKRRISWRSEKIFEAEDGEDIPREFDFGGAVIFVSNINFQRAVASGNKIAPHLEALMSRSYYLDLNLNSIRELIVRIKSVVANSDILSGEPMKIKKKDADRIVEYISDNQTRMRELSLRSVVKLGTLWKTAKGNEDKFLKMANATCLVKGRK